MFTFLRSGLKATSSRLLMDEAANALAVAEVGEWVLDMDDARFWSSVANVARQRGRVRLYKALRTGKLRAYIRVDDQPELRVVDTGYWLDPQHIFLELPALLAPQPQVGFELCSVVTGRNVPPGCEGEPIFVLADDIAAMLPTPSACTTEAATKLLEEGLGETSLEDDDHADGVELTGDPGRPGKGAARYMAEFERRLKAGEAEPKVSHEAAQLLQWFKTTHPGKPISTVGNIENRIRPLHRRHFPNPMK